MRVRSIIGTTFITLIVSVGASHAAGTGSDFYPADFSGKNMSFEKTMEVPMTAGNPVKVHIIKMRGRRMAVVPVDVLESLLSRAEGHSIALQ